MGSPGEQSAKSAADNNLETLEERAPMTQVMTFKTFSMQSFIKMMQAVAMRSCTKACQFFCLPVVEKSACSPDKTPHFGEKKNAQDRLLSPPSTVLIINISNSTLIDCVIGDSHLSAAAELQTLMQESDLEKTAEVSCSCCHRRQEAAQPAPSAALRAPAEHLNINILSSRLNSVIIGDNNYMNIQQNEPFD
ncbi:hypothetical protein CHARACLAT_016217 [Characodon lateralis]|uniref:Uncharacterized protein n=1 Tax=Characodon lateralis TaxID=208331 RepID=A0ABU7DS82_9TELE|nr:hypothetical protein [Characodon lateralis]